MLPVDGHVSEDAGEFDRGSITSLFPPDTILVVPKNEHIEPELQRTWQDAAHHIDLARRRGDDVPNRDELFDSPKVTLAALKKLGTIAAIEDGRRAT